MHQGVQERASPTGAPELNESEPGTFVVGSAESARNLVGHAVELADGLEFGR